MAIDNDQLPTYVESHQGGRLDAIMKTVQLVVFDFDGVFTDNTVYVDENGIESVRCWRSDGIGLSRLRMIGVQTLILSTEVNPVVSARAKKMNSECLQGIDDKARTLKEYCTGHQIDLKRVAFVGNDVNDISALKLVGLPIGVSDSYPEIFPHVQFRTLRRGGEGAVREVCDLIFHAHNASR
jgi:YrbI family 3-deoxy-D-manno-octulosonate 8-phosphate phosphatase